MNLTVYAKHYTDPTRRSAAQRHLRWLRSLGAAIRLPAEYAGTPTRLVLEHLPGRHAAVADLITVAGALGQLHGAAYAKELYAARLDHDHATRNGIKIAGFRSGRERVLGRIRVDLNRPAALYKDCNLRNVVVSESGAGLVDFDDLTLAPFGYDVAKLVVSLAMTHGCLEPAHVAAALAAYTGAVARAGGPANSCTVEELHRYAEIHHLLTAPYLNRNGYRHAWPDVRSWPTPQAEPEGVDQ